MTGRRLAIVAGKGLLAPRVAAAALNAGDVVLVLALSPLEVPAGVTVRAASTLDTVGLIAAIREFGATHVVLAGAVALGEADRHAIAGALGGQSGGTGDVALSQRVGENLQRLTGAELVGLHAIMPELLAPSGHIAGPELQQEDIATGRLALEGARAIGRLDLGQAVVAAGTRLVAAEDVAGTDDLLRRVARYRDAGLIGGKGTMVALGKAVKPQQPDFVDLPAIGPDTVVNAAAAGVRLIAIEAHRTLLLDRSTLAAQADRLGVSIVGLDG